MKLTRKGFFGTLAAAIFGAPVVAKAAVETQRFDVAMGYGAMSPGTVVFGPGNVVFMSGGTLRRLHSPIRESRDYQMALNRFRSDEMERIGCSYMLPPLERYRGRYKIQRRFDPKRLPD